MSKKFFSLSIIVLCFVPVLSMAQRYTVTDLGPLSPTGINSWAQVVGNYNNQAYIWTFGRMRDLGILQGGTFSSAAAINDLGTVTGTADGTGTVLANRLGFDLEIPCDHLIQPFVWKQQMRGLGTVGPATNVGLDNPPGWCNDAFFGAAINNRGQVVGYTAQLDNGYQWGFTWTSKDGMILFGGSWIPTLVEDVSNTGLIVGEDSWYTPQSDATWWKDVASTGPGSGTKLVELGVSSSASGVNDLGQIVGWSTIGSNDCYYDYLFPCSPHAVLWSPNGEITELGTLSGDAFSAATRINQFGLVIGSSGDTVTRIHELDSPPYPRFYIYPEVIGRPFIWSRNTGMQDLNTLIRNNSGWVLQTATDINVWGQIVGSGTRNGQPHGYLLTPVNPFQVF